MTHASRHRLPDDGHSAAILVPSPPRDCRPRHRNAPRAACSWSDATAGGTFASQARYSWRRVSRLFAPMFALILVLFFGSHGASASGAAGWTNEVERALQGAAERGQSVLLYVSSDQCKYCTQMVQTTLAEPRLRQAIEQGFVPVSINGRERPDLVRRLKIRSFPTTVVLDARGRVVRQVVGFQTSARLWQQVGPHARLAKGPAGGDPDDVATQSPAPVVNASDLRAADLRAADLRAADMERANTEGSDPAEQPLPR